MANKSFENMKMIHNDSNKSSGPEKAFILNQCTPTSNSIFTLPKVPQTTIPNSMAIRLRYSMPSILYKEHLK
jgi:hypothetical protein